MLNAAVEFRGPGVATLSMDERLTIANMTTEWGALVGWFPADETTLRLHAPSAARRLAATGRRARHRRRASRAGRTSRCDRTPTRSTPARIKLDLATVTPHVAGPDSVQVMTSLAEMEPQEIAIHKAYLVSCVNSRLEDIEAAAAVLRRARRSPTASELYVAAASREVQEQAEASGAWQTLLDAGARPLPPGCGPCIGLGTGLLEAGEVGISATNRNFKGRMGSRDAQCYLASPAVVAASAAGGHIAGPAGVRAGVREQPLRAAGRSPAGRRRRVRDPATASPSTCTGRLVFLPQDNLNTDGIYGKDYTYRDDMTPREDGRGA